MSPLTYSIIISIFMNFLGYEWAVIAQTEDPAFGMRFPNQKFFKRRDSFYQH